MLGRVITPLNEESQETWVDGWWCGGLFGQHTMYMDRPALLECPAGTRLPSRLQRPCA